MELPFFSPKKEPGKNYLALKISPKSLTASLWQLEGGKVSVGKIQTADLPSPADFLSVADEIISKISADLVPEPKEILFGLSPDWIVNGKISEPHTDDLKKLCQELGFSPLGFVAIPDAIANYLKEVESAPLTAILVGLEANRLFVTIVRAGKNLGVQSADISTDSSVNEFLETALKQFQGIEILPSRILIYDGRSDLEKLREQILSFPWTQKLPFLHFPKVEIIDAESVAKAVAIAGGTELGGKMTIEPPPEPTPLAPSADDLGFFKDRDITVPQKPKPSLPKFHFSFPAFPKVNFYVPLLVSCFLLLTALSALIVYLNFFTTASVTVFVTPKILQKDQDITVVTSGEIKEKEAKILGQIIEVDEAGAKRTITTGKKLVGTKARGAVTIFATTIGKTFPTGTVLVGPNNLRFSLDSEVTVASGSAASSATALGNVTALGIGESYNLGSGSLLSLVDYPSSSYQAKNDSQFSGGTSRQAQVVVLSDQDRLMATLSAELITKSLQDLHAKLSPAQNLLEKATASQVAKKQFDRALDEEADSVGLNLSMHFTGVVVDQGKLVELFGRLSVENVPPGYEFSPSQSSAEVTKTTLNKDNSVSLTTHFNAKLLPQMDMVALAKSLSGKSYSAAKKYLSSLSSVADSSFTLSPKLLSSFQIIPRNPKNITFNIVAQ